MKLVHVSAMHAADPIRRFTLPPGVAVAAEPLTRRRHAEAEHPYRSPFVRDIGRVLHARAFRRLAGKTQVFTRMPGEMAQDHFRSRLTHTLEVAQIARTAAATLGLNAELAEALALSHDIGHPPFGHAGEKALDRALRRHGLGFDHNLHALRIVDWFEQRYPAFRGLNLTLGVREGIVKHSHDYAPGAPGLDEFFLDVYPPLEAQLIDLADEFAYLTADLEDGLDSGILTIEQVRASVGLFRRVHDQALSEAPAAAPRLVANDALRRMLNAMATDLIVEIHRCVCDAKFETLDEVRHAPARLAALSQSVEAERAEAKAFLYANLYNSPDLEETHNFATEIVDGVFNSLMEDPALLPDGCQSEIEEQGLVRTVADQVAGMTDSYIQKFWSQIR